MRYLNRSIHKKLLISTVFVTSLFAVDYTNMSLEEMSNLRGTVSAQEREAFREAFQEKMKYLTPEERVKYSRGKGNASMTQQQKKQQTKQQLRDRSGMGSGYGSGSGGGSGGGRR
ncbi:MAG: hypothetical protein U9R16_07340 [Campylobacterota bacterium]|nr:hypothetical protein [Campylobacterota bacterium]